MKKGKLFPVGEYKGPNVMAQSTGEFRKPKKGEYFISGAMPTSYIAYNDMSTSYNIAKLVRVKRVEVVKVVEDL